VRVRDRPCFGLLRRHAIEANHELAVPFVVTTATRAELARAKRRVNDRRIDAPLSAVEKRETTTPVLPFHGSSFRPN
jgi:hypothetical protein